MTAARAHRPFRTAFPPCRALLARLGAGRPGLVFPGLVLPGLLFLGLGLVGPSGVARAADYFAGDPSTGDLYGAAVASVGDLNHDGYGDFAVGDPGDDNGGTDAGRVFVYFGRAANLPTTPDLVLRVGNGGDQFGFSIVGLGRFNGDEFDDLAVGAPNNDGAGLDAGRVYIFYGGANMNATPDLNLAGQTAGDHFGWSLAGGFDFNGDGTPDLAVGAPDRSNAQLQAGEVRIFYGASSPSTTAAVILAGENARDQFGFALHGAGHFNGDTFDDLVVGAPQQFQLNKGRAYVCLGRAGSGAPTRVTFEGTNGTDRFGWAVGGGGNVNGDGYDDIVVGAPRHDANSVDNGSAYLFLGGATPDVEADAQIDGRLGNDHLGLALALDGDYNKDGKDDLITGSPDANDNGTDSGNIEIWLGGSPLDSGSRILLTGPEPAPGVGAGDHFGAALAFVDYNGDGRAEVLGGAPDGNLPNGETVGLAALKFYPGTLVPVSLTGFEAHALDGRALLEWRTPGDDQPLGFHVERRVAAEAGTTEDAWQRRTGAPLVADGDGIWRFNDAIDGLPADATTLEYRLVALERSGATTLFGPYRLVTEPAFSDRLLQNAPNPLPAGGETHIRFLAARDAAARLVMYDLTGRPVRHLLETTVASGWTELTWDGRDDAGRPLPAGAYFYRLELGAKVLTRKLLLRP